MLFHNYLYIILPHICIDPFLNLTILVSFSELFYDIKNPQEIGVLIGKLAKHIQILPFFIKGKLVHIELD